MTKYRAAYIGELVLTLPDQSNLPEVELIKAAWEECQKADPSNEYEHTMDDIDVGVWQDGQSWQLGETEFEGNKIELIEEAKLIETDMTSRPQYSAIGFDHEGYRVRVFWNVVDAFTRWDEGTCRWVWVSSDEYEAEHGLDAREEDMCDWDHADNVEVL